MPNHANDVKDKVWRWLDEVVIGEHFCPFAKMPRLQNSIRLVVCDAANIKDVLNHVAKECHFLDEHGGTETTLIALSKVCNTFDDYLYTLDLANDLLTDIGYEGIYQLASFHPEYLFEGEAVDDLSHFTNRAPYPIFHIIREDSITRVLAQVNEPHKIPTRNIAHANSLGAAFFKQFL